MIQVLKSTLHLLLNAHINAPTSCTSSVLWSQPMQLRAGLQLCPQYSAKQQVCVSNEEGRQETSVNLP